MFKTRAILLACAALIPATSAMAQEEAPKPVQSDDDFHGDIVVKAPGLDRLDLLAGTSVVSGMELQRNQAGQIGDVLVKLPGVSASGFAPGASRPILRGFSGERVRILNDGLGTIDASSASSDHAVTVDPLLVDRVEVLRGPAVLLYGSQAIGGAVNIHDKRIPPAVPDEPIHIDTMTAFDTVSDLREVGASVDVPVGKQVAFHVDGSYRKTNDLEIPGYAASDALRQELLASAAEEIEEGHDHEAEEMQEAASIKDKLPNSATETYSLGTGVSFFSGESSLGVSFGYYDTKYGVPSLPGIGHVHEHEEEGHDEDHDHDHEEGADDDHDHDHEEEGDVTIGMKKYRVDLAGVLDTGDGFIDEIRTRVGYSDYTHTEFEGDETGTVFDVSGVEARMEFVQSRRDNWSGSFGAQYYHQDFSATGEEAFIPENLTDQYAVFALQEVDLSPVNVQIGARYEHQDIDLSDQDISRDFDSFSGALGLSYGLTEYLRAGVNFSRSERAPSAQELFADGPHVATQQYEIGDADLSTEKALGLEGYVRGNVGDVKIGVSVYKNWFDDFIYLAETGGEEDGLEVHQFLQDDADHFGVEGEVSFPFYKSDDLTLLADFRGDYTHAELADGSPVPRIPPVSLLGAVEAQMDAVNLRAEVEWYGKQDDVAEHETPTDEFTFVNLSAAWQPWKGNKNITLMVQADNIFDSEGRRATSFTKEYTPLPGRNFKISLRTSF
ncbi:TonB-dependent receptor [Altericroceibacterium endophyticum]|uniref:TonB-dependent receptor n=1 Tax=Altericroceibacterium endophyticum TaxID=1808508 RepID=A0A6I4T7S8_9SPHN|nr:TonB-dependent receptor [Altericroceibacterium endophyticum]MXO65910.1 TonB-dependent receptor [Altericroceibacterium endophyticum]